MTKTYKLLIDSAIYPKDTMAEYLEKQEIYHVCKSNTPMATQEQFLEIWQVENRPEVWELQEEKLDLCSPEAEKMRAEARAKRWEFVPTVGSLVFCYDHAKNKPCRITYTQSFCNDWNNGFIKRTEEEAQAHGEKYARYFLTE